MTDLASLLSAAISATTEAGAKHLVVGRDKAKIKQATTELGKLLALWTEHNKAATDVIRTLLSAARSQCDHVGATSGHNDRDGSWMNPCPTCGHSE